jgi:hypothetical protein
MIQNKDATRASLRTALQSWLEDRVDDAPWEGYHGDRVEELMTDAAFAVLEAYDDLTDYCRSTGTIEP